jgi:hydroxyethylthiazole kinase
MISYACCFVVLLDAVWQVTDGSTVLEVHNGVPMLTKITAAGCSVTAMIAGMLAIAQPQETLLATATALAVFG